MTGSLASAFRNGNSRRTKWQGSTVHSVFELNVSDGDVVSIERLSASPTRAQALKLALDKGSFRANGLLLPSVAVWSHTAPAIVNLDVVGRRAHSVDVWNGWSFDGVDSSWLGNAGMIVDKLDDGFVFRCSDGLGQPTFDDLVVQVRVRRA